MKISDLPTAEEIHKEAMSDPEYASEYERTEFANQVAIMVLRYRAEHNLTQTALARMLGLKQPNIARLESGEHEPSVSTLAKLSAVLGIDFSLDIEHGHVGVRKLANAG